MKDDDLTQQYLNNSPLQRQVCLLGAPRCHGVGLIVGALGVSRDQLRDALLEGILSLLYHQLTNQVQLFSQ
jgi:hypothetical protein